MEFKDLQRFPVYNYFLIYDYFIYMLYILLARFKEGDDISSFKGSLSGVIYLTWGYKCLWSHRHTDNWSANQYSNREIDSINDIIRAWSHPRTPSVAACHSTVALTSGEFTLTFHFVCQGKSIFSGVTQGEWNLISSHTIKKDPNYTAVYKGL